MALDAVDGVSGSDSNDYLQINHYAWPQVSSTKRRMQQPPMLVKRSPIPDPAPQSAYEPGDKAPNLELGDEAPKIVPKETKPKEKKPKEKKHKKNKPKVPANAPPPTELVAVPADSLPHPEGVPAHTPQHPDGVPAHTPQHPDGAPAHTPQHPDGVPNHIPPPPEGAVVHGDAPAPHPDGHKSVQTKAARFGKGKKIMAAAAASSLVVGGGVWMYNKFHGKKDKAQKGSDVQARDVLDWQVSAMKANTLAAS